MLYATMLPRLPSNVQHCFDQLSSRITPLLEQKLMMNARSTRLVLNVQRKLERNNLVGSGFVEKRNRRIDRFEVEIIERISQRVEKIL